LSTLPFRLFCVTDRKLAGGEAALLDRVERIARAGGGRVAFQLREKDLAPDALIALARRMKERAGDCPVLVNDRADIARAIGAAGVHLRATSIAPADARPSLPPGALTGRSTHGPDEVRRARDEGADYVFFGPVFSTPSKAEHGPPQGWVALETACAAAGTMPVFAIGGVTVEQVPRVLACGAWGVAAIRTLVGAPDPGPAVEAYLAALPR
jgi:thiamine-phosphate pyrophosphorylase